MRLILTTLTLSLAAAVAAMPASAATFERDGSRYEYNSIAKSDGAVLIDGRDIDDGTSFSLRVLAGHVTGIMGGRSVDFFMPNDAIGISASEQSKSIAAK